MRVRKSSFNCSLLARESRVLQTYIRLLYVDIGRSWSAGDICNMAEFSAWSSCMACAHVQNGSHAALSGSCIHLHTIAACTASPYPSLRFMHADATNSPLTAKQDKDRSSRVISDSLSSIFLHCNASELLYRARLLSSYSWSLQILKHQALSES